MILPGVRQTFNRSRGDSQDDLCTGENLLPICRLDSAEFVSVKSRGKLSKDIVKPNRVVVEICIPAHSTIGLYFPIRLWFDCSPTKTAIQIQR
jgi:hypothetical protein